jgi:hypothetical protein
MAGRRSKLIGQVDQGRAVTLTDAPAGRGSPGRDTGEGIAAAAVLDDDWSQEHLAVFPVAG